jgi:hypothetical protein
MVQGWQKKAVKKIAMMMGTVSTMKVSAKTAACLRDHHLKAHHVNKEEKRERRKRRRNTFTILYIVQIA